MRTIYCSILLLMSLSLSYGQNQILKTKLVYTSQVGNADSAEGVSKKVNNYIPEKYSENALSLINMTYGESDHYTTYDLYTKKKFLKVSTDGLDNNLSIENSYYYLNDIDSLFQDYYFYKTKDVVKTSEKNTILGYSCQYYTLTPEDSTPPVSLCIDEKNAINNASYFLPNKNIKGLVLDIRQQFDSEEESHFTLTNVEKVNVGINFDYDKELQKIKEKIIEAEAYSADVEAVEAVGFDSSSIYDDPVCSSGHGYFNSSDSPTANPVLAHFIQQYTINLCSHYTFDDNYDGNYDLDKKAILDFASRDIKSYAKNLRKAKLIDKGEEKKLTEVLNKIINDSKKFKLTKEVVEYESYYKDIDLNDISLAVESTDETSLNSIPKYCTNLKETIPSFENKELKNIVHNYTGQICDLYLYEIDNYQVDLRGTLESIRKGVLQLENIKEDLNDSDKQKLKTFLNSLD